MTPPHSRPRQQAEFAFAKAQSQFLARARAVEDIDAIVKARQERTLQLKAARLARELDDRARASTTLPSKRAVKA